MDRRGRRTTGECHNRALCSSDTCRRVVYRGAVVSDELQNRLDRLAERLGRGVSIDDTRGHMVAYSAHRGPVDPVRTSGILTRDVPRDVAAWQDEHLRGARGPVRVPANERLGMTPRLAMPLRHSGTLYGHLWVLEDDVAPLSRAERAATSSAAAEIVGLLAESGRAHSGRVRRDQRLVELLLDGKKPDLGDPGPVPTPQHEVIVAVVAPVTGVPPRPLEPRAATDELLDVVTSVQDVRIVAGIRSGMVTALWPHDADPGQHPAKFLRDTATRRLPKYRFVAGASGPARSVAELPRSERMARYAAEVAAADPATSDALTWTDLGALRLLAEHWPITPADLDTLFPEIATLLRTRNGAAFAASAETFLDNAGHIGQTAERLSIHRATLYYRLDRITAATGLDLSDGAARTTLHLGLKAARLAGLLIP
jgi:PucR C-terminal helix-turn-helix domain/GGDEF-like domain